MSRPRTPLALAEVTGRIKKDPGRFKNRRSPAKARPLGPPPPWLTSKQREAWALFSAELPWLSESHRAIVELACLFRARLLAGEQPGVAAMTLYRQCLGQLGATPADESKVSAPPPDEESKAIEEKYFQ